MSLLIKNGELVSEEFIGKKDIFIDDEKIKAIKDFFNESEIPEDCEIIDAEGKYVLPGIIDAHTHYFMESRNSITADDFYSGTISAAFGGVTTFIDYSEQVDNYSMIEAISKRVSEAQKDIVIDFSLHHSVYSINSNIKNDLKELSEYGISSLKIFTTYKKEGYMIDEEKLIELFKLAKDFKLLITVHAEDDQLIEEILGQFKDREDFPPHFHPFLRPSDAEYMAVMKIGNLANLLNMPVYIAHLSSKKGCHAIKKLRSESTKIYCETTPHYLLLTNDLLNRKDAQKYIMTPPLREKEDNAALWQAVKRDDVSVIATDHCSFTVEQKLCSNNCLDILPGIPGSETMMPLVYTFGVRGGHFDIRRMVSVLSTNPAKIFGLYPEKGSLKCGTDADIVIFDPNKKVTISSVQQHTAAGYSPYEGIEVTGYPIITILRGNIVVDNGILHGERGMGRFIKADKSILYKEV